MYFTPKEIFVFDTNVVVHALKAALTGEYRFDHVLAFNLLAMATQQHHVYASNNTMGEITEVTIDLKGLTDTGDCSDLDRRRFINRVKSYSKIVVPQPVSVQCCDPKDQMFLEAAMGASQKMNAPATIITNDNDILSLQDQLQEANIPITVSTPVKKFVDLLPSIKNNPTATPSEPCRVIADAGVILDAMDMYLKGGQGLNHAHASASLFIIAQSLTNPNLELCGTRVSWEAVLSELNLRYGEPTQADKTEYEQRLGLLKLWQQHATPLARMRLNMSRLTRISANPFEDAAKTATQQFNGAVLLLTNELELLHGQHDNETSGYQIRKPERIAPILLREMGIDHSHLLNSDQQPAPSCESAFRNKNTTATHYIVLDGQVFANVLHHHFGISIQNKYKDPMLHCAVSTFLLNEGLKGKEIRLLASPATLKQLEIELVTGTKAATIYGQITHMERKALFDKWTEKMTVITPQPYDTAHPDGFRDAFMNLARSAAAEYPNSVTLATYNHRALTQQAQGSSQDYEILYPPVLASNLAKTMEKKSTLTLNLNLFRHS